MIVPEIIPSLLAADFARLGEEIANVESGGALMLHIDVMDGHFVPNLTMGPPVVRALRKVTKSLLDVHLMILNPDDHLEAFASAGANLISVHQETCPHLHRTLQTIRSLGAKAGIVLNPGTPVETLTDVLDSADFVLLMSVNPGFGGQVFIPSVLNKAKRLDRLRRDSGLNLAIEIDGGIGPDNVADCVRAGCDWLVAGTSVFGNPDPASAVSEMSRAARTAASIRV
jgi:ribulose-phosphate 3-epimerase